MTHGPRRSVNWLYDTPGTSSRDAVGDTDGVRAADAHAMASIEPRTVTALRDAIFLNRNLLEILEMQLKNTGENYKLKYDYRPG